MTLYLITNSQTAECIFFRDKIIEQKFLLRKFGHSYLNDGSKECHSYMNDTYDVAVTMLNALTVVCLRRFRNLCQNGNIHT